MCSREDLERKRSAIILCWKSGKKNCEIVNDLKESNVNFNLVKRTIDRFQETGSTKLRGGPGRPRSKRTPAMLKALKARIRRNPCRSQAKLALQFGTSSKTIRKALKVDLGLKPLKRGTCHMMTVPQKIARIKKCRRLLQRYATKKVKSILFTDEKVFNVEEHLNRQNDRIYAKSVKDIPPNRKKVKRCHGPGSVMVWAGFSWHGKAPLHFVQKGVKVAAKNYIADILEPVVKPLNHSLFNDQRWTFQQDSAPAHKAKITQAWLKSNTPDFIATEDWPSASPDLNPLDYAIWSKLEAKVCARPHTSVEALKQSLVREWAKFPIESLRNSVDEWRPRLQQCINAKGGYFEM